MLSSALESRAPKAWPCHALPLLRLTPWVCTGMYGVLLMQDLPSCRTVKPCISYLIILGVAAMTGPKCGLAWGWRECKLGGLPMNFYLGRQVQTMESIIGKQSWLNLCPAALYCAATGKRAKLMGWFSSGQDL